VLKHLDERRQDETGFTLIELMVVVLIMGILMAIAIPTFLSTRGAAYDAGAKSNATNAYTGEKAYYQDNQVFLDLSASGGSTLDNSLPWTNAATATSNTVTADAYVEASGAWTAAAGAGKTGNALLIEADAKTSNNCFYIADDESAAGQVNMGYAESSGGCFTPTKFPNGGGTLSTTGNASANIAAGAAPTTWYPSW
jgi:type IV pilus assembly protein PilA